VTNREPRKRFWLEAVLGTTAVVLTVVTVFWNDWIELVFKVDPDRGSGALEWALTAGMAAVALGCFIAARYEWRRARPAAPALGRQV
jgi:hypothetical protein